MNTYIIFKVFGIIQILSALTSTVNAANVVVAHDGFGNYKTVQEAINAAPSNASASNRWVIHIKPGTYKEHIHINKRFISLVGENAEKTILTHNLYAQMKDGNGKEIGTFSTPSTFVDADDFTSEGLTFENSAGPVGQALAIRIDGDRVVFRNCRFLGWQDTILANKGRHYFYNCFIEGHVDFIFGAATSFFDHCNIQCLRDGYITAASTPKESAFGFVFWHCHITGVSHVRTYLGRPWRPYASVVYLNTDMSEVVRPEGWNNWKNASNEKTARYSEYGSTGAGGNTDSRVKWAHHLSAADASAITPAHVLNGHDHWNP